MNQSEPSNKAKLEGLLEEWHKWCSKTDLVSTPGKCAMFSQAQSPRHWDTASDIDDSHIQQSTMAAMDFAILGDNRAQGGMVDPYRTAITFYARNLCARVRVWHSPRLPTNEVERVAILNKSLEILQRKLEIAGIL